MNLTLVERIGLILFLVGSAFLTFHVTVWPAIVAWTLIGASHLLGRAGKRGHHASVGTLVLGWLSFVLVGASGMLTVENTTLVPSFGILSALAAQAIWLTHRADRREKYLRDDWGLYLRRHLARGASAGVSVAILAFLAFVYLSRKGELAEAEKAFSYAMGHLAAGPMAGGVSGVIRPALVSALGVIVVGLAIALTYYLVFDAVVGAFLPSAASGLDASGWLFVAYALVPTWPAIALGVRDGELDEFAWWD